MIEFDDHGYTYSFPYMSQNEMMKQACDLQGVTELDGEGYAKLFMACRDGVRVFEQGVREHFDWKSFPEFMLDFFSIARQHDAVGRFMERMGPQLTGNSYKYDATNEALLSYHTLRFIRHGKTVYKLAPHKADFLSKLELDIPGSLLFAPHPEFMISIPKGVVTTDLGQLLNIYVSQDTFSRSVYENPRYQIDAGVAMALANPDIDKIFRAVGVFYNDNGNSQTAYFQMPVSRSRSVTELFTEMVEMSAPQYRQSVAAVFKLVLNTCAYLGVRDADIQKVLGITYTAKSNPKKARLSERNNRLYGYDHFYVGKIYDDRCRSNGGGGGNGSKILKRFKVRAHIRAQWYGQRGDGVPGTKQRLILIDEFEKGSDLEVELSEKVTEVGR